MGRQPTARPIIELELLSLKQAPATEFILYSFLSLKSFDVHNSIRRVRDSRHDGLLTVNLAGICQRARHSCLRRDAQIRRRWLKQRKRNQDAEPIVFEIQKPERPLEYPNRPEARTPFIHTAARSPDRPASPALLESCMPRARQRQAQARP